MTVYFDPEQCVYYYSTLGECSSFQVIVYKGIFLLDAHIQGK